MKLIKLIILLLFLILPHEVKAVLTSGSVTIKTAAGTYSTWAAFWDDLGNLTGNITCTVDASAFTEGAAPVATTETLGGYTLHVLPAAFPTATDASDGARFTCNYVGNILTMGMEGAGTVIIEGIVFIEGSSEPASAIRINTVITEFTFIVRRNIFKGCGVTLFQNDATVNTGTQWYNNILYDASTYGIQVAFDIPAAIIANNTIHACINNIFGGDEEVTFENNLSYAGGTNDYINIGVLTIGNNNANSDATGENADWGGGGVDNVNSIGDPFTNLAADDFTITVEGVVGTAGKNLSGKFTNDFFGLTRGNWTIGACEFEPITGLDISGISSVLDFSGILYTGISGITP